MYVYAIYTHSDNMNHWHSTCIRRIRTLTAVFVAAPVFVTTRDIFRQATVTEHVANVTRIDHRTSIINAVVVDTGVCDVRRCWTTIDCKRSLIKVNAYMFYTCIGNYWLNIKLSLYFTHCDTQANTHSQLHDCG